MIFHVSKIVYNPVQGISRVFEDGKWYHAEPDGFPLTHERFMFVWDFSHGLGLVKQNEDTFFFVDPKGKQMFGKTFSRAYPFSGGFAAIKNGCRHPLCLW